MKKTTDKVEVLPYIDEDILFLILKLADYPSGKKRTISYEELRGQQDDATFIKMMHALLEMRHVLGGIEIPDLKFNAHYFNKKQKERISALQEFLRKPESPKPAGEKLFLENIFSIIDNSTEDIKTVVAEALSDILSSPRHVGFEIIVSERCQKKLFKIIEAIVETFIDEKFKSDKENYCTFSNHKKQGFETIAIQVRKYGYTPLLRMTDFDEDLRFAEFILALHKLRYLNIQGMPITKEVGFAFQVEIKKKLIDEEKRQEKDGQNTEQAIQPLNIPYGTAWEDIEIRFKNEYDIEIFVHGKFFINTNNEQLGFFDSRSKDKKPSSQWTLLRGISANRGILDMSRCADELARERIRKQKEKLSKQLKFCFGISEYDPFETHNDRMGYIAKFKVQPDPDLRGDGEIRGVIDKLD